jgi:hypothetical protein
MRFGVFYELQLPRPWEEGDERNLFHQALEQVELADRLGFDYAWEVEHHFLEEYSHSSAPEVFLASATVSARSFPITIIRPAPPKDWPRSTSSPTGGLISASAKAPRGSNSAVFAFRPRKSARWR